MGDSSSESSDSEPTKKRSRPNFDVGGSAGLLTEDMREKLSNQYAGAEALARGQPPPQLPPRGLPKGMGKGMPMELPGMADAVISSEPRVETQPMDFSRTRDLPTAELRISKTLAPLLMTTEFQVMLAQESGAEVVWIPQHLKASMQGSPEQLQRAQRLLARVTTHCRWGHSASKIRRLLRPERLDSLLCRLSPMDSLKPAQKTLTLGKPTLTIGKDKGNDVFIKDEVISRSHCVLELDCDRGGAYVADRSTNGTFLNGLRLPGKHGKVLLSHGDELLLKDPATGEQEFGYIVNLPALGQKEQKDGPRRMTISEETIQASK